MAMEIRVNRQPSWMRSGIEVRIVDPETRRYVKEVHWTVAEANDEVPVAASMKMDMAQSLMDQLWDCGLRPTEGTGSAGALAAVERHLADMKIIAFHALKIA